MNPHAPIPVALVGAGNRTLLYAEYALKHPDQMKIVAAADPDPGRRALAARLHDIPPEALFDGFESFVRQPQMAHAVINGTMDQMHFDSSVALMKAGYHMLLEKPIAGSEWEVRELIRCATEEYRRTVMICHVLRYAPFYQTIQQALEEGRIGRMISLHTSENVSYHHMATAFVRGRWRREDTSNPMLLAKCCHDLDLIAWLMGDRRAVKVASFGSLTQFRKENAPADSAERCLAGCAREPVCTYSARSMYIDQARWGNYAWESVTGLPEMTAEMKLASLRTENPYGRCVWRCDNDVVDHQNVLIEFEDGTTASHNMLCATSRPTRTIHLVGEEGELEGDLEAPWIRMRRHSRTAPDGFVEESIPLVTDLGGPTGHGGGDLRLVEDFVKVLRGEPASPGSTKIEDSLNGHLFAFYAEASRRENRVVEF